MSKTRDLAGNIDKLNTVAGKYNSTSGTFENLSITDLAGDFLPDTNETRDLGSSTKKFKDLYLSSNSLHLGSKTVSADQILDFDLSIAPEVLEIQVDSPTSGQNAPWLWTWLQSTLPYARRTITNSPELTVPLYKQGTYVVNNYAAYDLHDSMTQTHNLYFKWIDGAGTDNLISWAVDNPGNPISDTHPDINGGIATDVQRITINVPATITLPTLNAPSVGYTVTNNGSGAFTYSGSAKGDNPNLGPWYRGGTYTFTINASGHPLYLTTDNGTNFSSGTYFGEYTTGVTGSRTDSGTLTITVPSNAPDTLYYQCGNHSAMRGAITIKDLAVETNVNGNYVVYAQHDQEGMKTPVELRPIPSLVNQMCLVYDNSTQKFVPQDLATYVENTPSFENKIREVAGTAELVVEDGSAVIAKVNVYNDSTYLPLVGNNPGDQAFATDTNVLYIWDGSAWQQAGSTNADDLTEGSTNLFYTDARVDARLASGSVGDVTISGNLQVNGTTTTINSTTLTVDDKNIVLANGSANAAASDGAGITADLGSDGTATILYNATNDDWNFNKKISVTGNIEATGTIITNGTTLGLGDNQKEFVATGTIATGDVVALRSDGTVELVGALIPSSEASYDSALQPYYSNTYSNSFDSAYDSVNNRIFIATTSDISAQIVITIGTISGSTITFGSGILTGINANYVSISTIDISGEPRFKIAYDQTTSQIILVVLQENSPFYDLLGYVGNISGNSITWSTSANYQNSVPMHITDLVVLPGKSQVVVNWVTINQNLGTNSWGSDYTNYYYAMVYNIGANSITGGTAKILDPNNGQYYPISRNKTVYIPTVSWSTWGTDASIALFYGDVNPGFYDAQIVNYLLCSVTSVGDIITQASGTVGPGGNNIARFDENSVAVHYDSISQNLVVVITKAYNTNETIIYASEIPRIQTATGFSAGLTLTDITNRTDAVLFTDTTNNLLKFAYSDSDTGTQYVSTITVGVNTGTSLPITQSDIVSLTQTGLSKGMQANVSNNDYIFTHLGLGSNSTNVGSTVYSLSYTNQNADSWIGIAAENIADTATGLIDLPGAVNRSQTGLTTNSIYYVDSDGSVTTTPTIYGKIGRAYSATELQIFESYKQLNFASHLIFGN